MGFYQATISLLLRAPANQFYIDFSRNDLEDLDDIVEALEEAGSSRSRWNVISLFMKVR